MGEFKDFVDDCGLETKEVNFALMTNMFVKVSPFCVLPNRFPVCFS